MDKYDYDPSWDSADDEDRMWDIVEQDDDMFQSVAGETEEKRMQAHDRLKVADRILSCLGYGYPSFTLGPDYDWGPSKAKRRTTR